MVEAKVYEEFSVRVMLGGIEALVVSAEFEESQKLPSPVSISILELITCNTSSDLYYFAQYKSTMTTEMRKSYESTQKYGGKLPDNGHKWQTNVCIRLKKCLHVTETIHLALPGKPMTRDAEYLNN